MPKYSTIIFEERGKGRFKVEKKGSFFLRIYSSQNHVHLQEKIYFCADLVGDVSHPVFPKWYIVPPIRGVKIDKNGVLSVSRWADIKREMEVTIIAKYGRWSSRKRIKLIPKYQRQGKFRVHFFKHEGDYTGWNIWCWNGGVSKACSFQYNTDLGVMAYVDLPNIIIRHSEPYNPWDEKATGDVRISRDIFVVYGDENIYTSFRKFVRATYPRVRVALMDSKYEVRAYLSNFAKKGDKFFLKKDGAIISEGNVYGKVVDFKIPHTIPFDPRSLYEVTSSGNFIPCVVRKRNVLDSFYYDGDDLGVTFTPKKIAFRLWCPVASSVEVLVYDGFNQPNALGKPYPMKFDPASGTWYGDIPREENYGKFWMYRLKFYSKTPYEKTTYALDPYVKAVSVNGEKGALIDPMTDPATFPHNWDNVPKPRYANFEDVVLYEVHVRDFSTDENSGIEEKYRGKFLAFTVENTHHPKYSKIKTCLSHLKELGITHVHLLPVFDFASVREDKPTYNWGYDPLNYNVPEGSYATDPYNPTVRIYEFRKMVQSLHKNNIGVVMDVVYNHTYSLERFNSIIPDGYYYRTDFMGRFSNGSGCGNEVATERPMVRKFIVDSVKYWVWAYKIDGFRFDLMGLIDTKTMEEVMSEVRKIDPYILIYGEPWAAGFTPLSQQMQMGKPNIRNVFARGYQIACFNDNFRDAIRGNNGYPHPSRAYVTGVPSLAPSIFRGAMGSVFSMEGDNDYTIVTCDPEQTINYVSAHDNLVLWDQIMAALGYKFPCKPFNRDALVKENVLEDLVVRRCILANGIILTSQGIPFIRGGEELLATKYGDANSYKSPDDINQIKWDWKVKYYDVFQVYKGLIHLKKKHPAFRLKNKSQIEYHIKPLKTPQGVVGFVIGDHANGDSWNRVVVVYNPWEHCVDVDLPKGVWKKVMDGNRVWEEEQEDMLPEISGRATIPPISVVIFRDVEKRW